MEFRPEIDGDYAAIRQLHLHAFDGAGEADLVERLRCDGDAVFSLVAIDNGVLHGHVMFSKMASPALALGLGPVAVLAGSRRQGIAARLIKDGLSRATASGWRSVFVLGDPAYYGRFGFSAGQASGFASPYAGPHLMVLSLAGEALSAATGRLEYAPAFAALS
jgi:putative acetyltransferase